jgi:hypothetical protein
MSVVWFLVSVIANLLTPAPAIGGAFTGAFGATQRPRAAFVVFGSTVAVIVYLAMVRQGDLGVFAYSVCSQCCAMTPWIFFTRRMARLLPDELSGGTRGGPDRWLARISSRKS